MSNLVNGKEIAAAFFAEAKATAEQDRKRKENKAAAEERTKLMKAEAMCRLVLDVRDAVEPLGIFTNAHRTDERTWMVTCNKFGRPKDTDEVQVCQVSPRICVGDDNATLYDVGKFRFNQTILNDPTAAVAGLIELVVKRHMGQY